MDVAEVVTRLLPLARTLSVGLLSHAQVELGRLEKAAARCPPALLERAIISLVTNASEATTRSGSVLRIDVEADEREVRVRVHRRLGPGIADHIVPRLFEHGFSTKGSAGRGTGLASLREAARRAGGVLRFEPGASGASFVLALPRA